MPRSFAGVMDHEDGAPMGALQLAKPIEDWGDLSGDVLVDAVEPHEGIQDQQHGPIVRHGELQSLPIRGIIQAQLGHGDDLEGDGGEIDAVLRRNASQQISTLDIGIPKPESLSDAQFTITKAAA
jgi:hypothetical protein